MAVATAVLLNGDDLTIDDVVDRGRANPGGTLRPRALQDGRRPRVNRRPCRLGGLGRAHLRDQHRLRPLRLRRSRRRLSEELSSASCAATRAGWGHPDEVVRAAMVLRANALAKGFSGARSRPSSSPRLPEQGVLPVVPSRGSVGASGDLAPLAHLASLVGEGRRATTASFFQGRTRSPAPVSSRSACRRRKGSRSSTEPSSWAPSARWARPGRRIAKTADIACALSVEALQGSRVSFMPEIQALRPLAGQAAAAANVLRLLEGSAIIEAHRWCDKVQDAYSRCAPQVHGASRDLLAYVEHTVAVEVNAATDNPLVLVEGESSSRTGTSTASRRARARLHGLALAELASISSAASSGSSTRRSPTGCPRSSRTTAGSTQGS